MNPYDWQGDRPQIEVPRAQTEVVLSRLHRGGSAVVLAGRGMGKSVFLRQIEAAAEVLEDVRVVRLRTSPPELSYRSCLDALAQALGTTAEGALDSAQLVDRYLRQDGAPRRLILLYDELDRYARTVRTSETDQPGRDYFNDLEATRKDYPVGILAAGGIGVFVFRDILGSSFLSRAEQFLLENFTRDEARRLAKPFAEREEVLPEDTLESLLLASGGIPALTTYGLERLWELESTDGQRIPEIFAAFKRQHRQYLDTVRRSFADEQLSGAPQRVWELVRRSGRPLSRDELREACRHPGDPLSLDYGDVVELLQAAGLVRLIGSVDADMVRLQPITSILSLEGSPSTSPSFRERFLQDLRTLLAQLHALSADFFRPGSGEIGKQLVPESVFSAFLAIGLQGLGWQAEREAQYGAGRTDLKLSLADTEGIALVEVKIWGRKHETVHRQIESYWSHGVVAGAVVMLTDEKVADWTHRYREKCLDPYCVEVSERDVADLPVHAELNCSSVLADRIPASINHFLLRLPKR